MWSERNFDTLPDMLDTILIILATVIQSEARGKGGAANGGGNSWRGGEEVLDFYLNLNSE